MYVYVNKKIDNMITIASQRGKINLVCHDKWGCSEYRNDNTRESIGGFAHLSGIIPCRKGDHRGDLEKAHLKGVR